MKRWRAIAAAATLLAAPATAWAEDAAEAAKPADAPDAAPEAPAAPAEAPPPPRDTLPDPWKTDQLPPPMLQPPPPDRSPLRIELGLEGGIVYRPAIDGHKVGYDVSWAAGAHARINLAWWLGLRINTRFEGTSASFSNGALGLPSGTSYDESEIRRIYVGAMLEPQWSPSPGLLLWTGFGLSWGRSTAPPLTTSGAQVVTLPTRSAVFIEAPFSLGISYEIIPRWMVLDLTTAVGVTWDQSGKLLRPYTTPGKDGELVTVEGFPQLGTSFAALGGVGILL